MGHVAEQEGGLPLKGPWGSLELERGKRMARDLLGLREYTVCVLGGRGAAKLGLQRELLARTAEDREASGVMYVGQRPGAKVLGQDLGPIWEAVRVGLGLGAKAWKVILRHLWYLQDRKGRSVRGCGTLELGRTWQVEPAMS